MDETEELGNHIGGLSLGSVPAADIPDFDDIPDMEEDDLEEGDEATAAPKTVPATSTSSGVIDARYGLTFVPII